MSSADTAAEIKFKLLDERVLSTGEPCTCESVTLLQSFHRGTLSIHGAKLKPFSLPFLSLSYLDALLRLTC